MAEILALAFRIEKMPDGGFVVSDTSPFGSGSSSAYYQGMRFASAKICDALSFIEANLASEPAKLKGTEPCSHCGSVGMQRYCSRCS